ncbi:hypothetical protein F0562_028492 [Nyssa sinensis]|uniref:Proline-rich protein n=1 Tax=Nyssa sinensis TaxID=561372 RepID=A0A5J5B087_9ASTE|nr:hypothetical protein F0562_028492 [Nyssa sinensis]
MGTHSLSRRALLGFWLLFLIFAVSFCYGDDKTVEVVGIGECADCAESNVKASEAFSGLSVNIDCKLANGEVKTRGVGKLDEEGKFKISLPQAIVKDGKLKEECFAQLHSASAVPCPVHNGIEDSKIVFKSKIDGKQTFGPAEKLKFSRVTCTSDFTFDRLKLRPPKFPPSLRITYLGKKPLFPSVPIYKKPFPPSVPIYKKPFPPSVPIYKKPFPPSVPIYKKPFPPPVPIYKKPLPPLVPMYKKPLPPLVPTPIPIYKPKPPISKP